MPHSATAELVAFDSPAARWKGVVTRDRRAAGLFVYAVRTTGVYCHPHCGSRLPRRANVEFFDSSALAEGKGYRACKKCRPKSAGGHPVPAAVTQACQLLDTSDATPTLAELASRVGYSPFHFHRLFKRHVGMTPREYVARRHCKSGETLRPGSTPPGRH
jgi:AraC family transcriptional regulator of adaptative response/methylated-DNA-[protein]-cysteine methyltransferase